MARKPDDWMPLQIGSYLADTTHLTRDQHGAYLLLLMAYWRRGAPLPADDDRLAAIAKATPEEWKKLKPILIEFFHEKEGFWHQKRADEELKKAVKLTEAKAAAGRAGAERRWHADDTTNVGKIAEPSTCHKQNDAPSPSPTQDTSSLRSDVTRSRASEPDLPDWVPIEAWKGYLDMRRRIRAPMTARAQALAIGQLDGLRKHGHDPTHVLDQSTQNSWKGLFEPRAKSNGTKHQNERKPTSTDQHLAGMSSIVSEIRARREA